MFHNKKIFAERTRFLKISSDDTASIQRRIRKSSIDITKARVVHQQLVEVLLSKTFTAALRFWVLKSIYSLSQGA